MKQTKTKEYEINGVMMYAHCYSFEVKAKNKKEAKKLAEAKIPEYIDDSNTEFQEYIMDEPIEIK